MFSRGDRISFTLLSKGPKGKKDFQIFVSGFELKYTKEWFGVEVFTREGSVCSERVR